MSAENLLQRLEKVKRTGKNKWSANCPAHDSKSGASLAVREVDDGRILLHCFGGCGAGEVLNAIGMEFADLYPKTADYHLPKVRRPWNASDVLAALSLEILTAWNFAKAMSSGESLTNEERARLLLCASRILKGLEVSRA